MAENIHISVLSAIRNADAVLDDDVIRDVPDCPEPEQLAWVWGAITGKTDQGKSGKASKCPFTARTKNSRRWQEGYGRVRPR